MDDQKIPLGMFSSFKYASETETNLNNFKRTEIYDAILVGVYKHRDFRNKNIMVGEEILLALNIKPSQHEIIDFLNDLAYEDLIRNIKESGHDFYFDLTPKTKNILDEHGTYTNFVQHEKDLRTNANHDKRIQNIGIIAGLAISIIALGFQYHNNNELEIKLHKQEKELEELKQQKDVFNLLLEKYNSSLTDTLTVIYLQNNRKNQKGH